MKYMKILQIGKTYPIIGGVDKVIFEISEGISRKKIQCDVLCSNIKKEDLVINNNLFSTFFVSKSYGKIAATWISPNMILKLIRIINKYDIIHIHHPDPMATIALFLANSKKQKIVLHWHSDIVKQKNLLKFYMPLQNWILRKADIIIATTNEYAIGSDHLKNYTNKIKVVPIGVNVDFSTNSNLINDIKLLYKNKKIIYSLGRLCYYKGFEYLIDAAKYLDDSYIILIGGTGPLKENLSKQIIESNLSSKVVLLGRIEDDDMSAYYSQCKVFCLPSVEKSEAFGIVQIEAMYYNKPIVATKIPNSGVSWVNKDSFSGINVNPKDSIGIANAIKSICENEDNYVQYSLNSRIRFENEFTSDKMIDRILKLYESL